MTRNRGIELSSPPNAVCIVRLSAIGDTCHTVPIVRAMQRAWPDTQITWIIGAVEHELMRGLEGVEFAVLDKRSGLRGYLDLRHRLRNRDFPLLLHMHASLRAGFASLAARAEIRLGFDRARARDYQWLFCNRRIEARPNRHVMDGLFEFLAAVGIKDLEPQWQIPLSKTDEDFATQVVGDAPSLVISPCTGQRFRNYRNWKAEHYAEIADYVTQAYGAKVILTGGNTSIEAEYGEAIMRLTRCSPTSLIAKTSLKQLLAIIARASIVLCPDSGPAHMATAVNTPVVGLYATSNRLRTGPYYSQHLVVDKYPEAVKREYGQPVEALRWGQRVRNPDAMSLIRVEDVVDKLDRAFTQRGIERIVGS